MIAVAVSVLRCCFAVFDCCCWLVVWLGLWWVGGKAFLSMIKMRHGAVCVCVCVCVCFCGAEQQRYARCCISCFSPLPFYRYVPSRMLGML